MSSVNYIMSTGNTIQSQMSFHGQTSFFPRYLNSIFDASSMKPSSNSIAGILRKETFSVAFGPPASAYAVLHDVAYGDEIWRCLS